MKLQFYHLLCNLFDRLRDVFDRLHGWALAQATDANIRQMQLRLNLNKREGWLR